MAWSLRDKEYQAVLSLSNERRYAYAIKRFADRGEIWSLWGEGGWVLAGDDSGKEVVPIWPHPRFAEACALGTWAGTQARAIEVHEFIDRWIPGMARDHRLVAVFPTPAVRGAVVAPEDLKRDLEAELALIE